MRTQPVFTISGLGAMHPVWTTSLLSATRPACHHLSLYFVKPFAVCRGEVSLCLFSHVGGWFFLSSLARTYCRVLYATCIVRCVKTRSPLSQAQIIPRHSFSLFCRGCVEEGNVCCSPPHHIVQYQHNDDNRRSISIDATKCRKRVLRN